MAVYTEILERSSTAGTDVFDITKDVQDAVGGSGFDDGVATVFVPGSTGAVTTLEFEPGLLEDIEALFERIAPRNMSYGHERMWRDGNGHSHVRAALLGPSLAVPFLEGKLALGTWQQIVLIDFDNKPRKRTAIVQVTG